MARTAAAAVAQTPEELVGVFEAFAAAYPAAVVSEEGKALFDLRAARWTVQAEHGRCTLHLWTADQNLVRRVVGAEQKGAVLKLATVRLGQARSQTLELAGDRERRTVSAREAARVRFVATLERALERRFEGRRAESFRTAMDLEHSFGPAYARGMLSEGAGLGTKSWAVIAVNAEETAATVDGILTFGILWLQHLTEHAAGRRLMQGLMVVVPAGGAALTLARMGWLRGGADGGEGRWQLFELDEREGTLTARDTSDRGNLETRLVHAPDDARARERFADAAARIRALVPAASRGRVEERLRSGAELAFLLHGLEFARARVAAAADSFNRVETVTVGTGADETALTAANEEALRGMVEALCARRGANGDKRDALYRMQPERWLESELRRDLTALDRVLDPAHVYTQVPALAGTARGGRGGGLDRGMLDLLGVQQDGRLVVIEVKAAEDPQMALQGLDYWVRVRWHHMQHADAATGLGEFQRHGYFGGVRLSPLPPRLLLVAPALRIHPATETVLRMLGREVDWTLAALDERWRSGVKVLWRRRSGG